jgi:hypothetical protein
MRGSDGISEGAKEAFPQDPVYLLLGRVVRYLEFETIWLKTNRDLWEQTPIPDHCGAFPIL